MKKATVAGAPAPLSKPQRASAPAARPKIRVGLFAGRALQPRWIAAAFAGVAASDVAEVVVIAHCAPCRGERPVRGHPPLWRLYEEFERRAFGAQPDPLELVDLKAAVPHGVALEWPENWPEDATSDASTEQAWLEAIGRLRLDVAFALDAGADGGEANSARLAQLLRRGVARYGVWRHFFGEGRLAAGESAGVREVLGRSPVTESGLLIESLPGGAARLAYRSWARTAPLSVARNRSNVLRKTSAFAERALRELHRDGEAWLNSCPPVPIKGEHPIQGRRARPGAAFPGTPETLAGLAGLGGRMAARGVQKLLCVDQWFIAYRFDGPGRNSRPWNDPSGFTRLVPPTDRFWADPFPLVRNGRYFIFFEELLFSAAKAHISVVEIDPSGRASEPVKVLERDYHLSYPFLVEHQGELFMVPETGENRTVEVHRCIEFPHRWRLEKVLLQNIFCVDATFLRTDGRWWMFGNVAVEGTEIYDELHLFHADDLFGEWRPHRRNPVKSDARCARPAGNFYRDGGTLYRPAQICAPLYGSGVSINRVLELTPDSYLEQEVERVLPAQFGGDSAGLLGIHTLNRDANLSVIDGFCRRRRLGP